VSDISPWRNVHSQGPSADTVAGLFAMLFSRRWKGFAPRFFEIAKRRSFRQSRPDHPLLQPTMPHAVIIGSGVIGLVHAITALERGWRVTVFERDGRALGASVRNFGTLWPIGCAFGPERDQALFGVRRWRDIGLAAGISTSSRGSLSLAYRGEAWTVLNEFAGRGDAFVLMEADEVVRRYPAVNPAGLRGALFSEAETVVHPPTALPALAAHAGSLGAAMHFGTPVTRVLEDAVETADGRRVAFDQLLIAAGDEMRLFFPHELAAAGLQRCRLQMMRTVPQPAGFELGAILVSDLTLCHYPAFRDCPGTAKLRARLEAELPLHKQWGIHVIAAQHPDGSLTWGDSHEYGLDFEPGSRAEVDDLILESLRGFARVPDLRIASRWQGVYLKSTTGRTQVVLRPRERVTMVTAMGGLGMTLGWGLAEQTLDDWESSASG
jgi:FAD dependent oxidoreductase TIGR03364